MRSFAKHLMIYEKQGSESSRVAPFQAIDKLRPLLATLMGDGGFRALFSRALVLAGAEVFWLHALHINADGALEGVEASHARVDPADFLEGRVVLLAQLLELLVAFIGRSLTLRLLSEIWPQIPLNDLDFDTGGDNEKAE
jgi:hypothetical protein